MLQVRHVLVAVALLAPTLALAACAEKPLLDQVAFSAGRITPNADLDTDVLAITYGLSRSADVSIYFVGEDGQRHFFRNHVHHGPSVEHPYQVYFPGVVEGYVLPGERFGGFAVLKRVLQDGTYTWVVEAVDAAGAVEQVTGTLTIAAADTALPELRGFSVYPPVFTPNRDGIGDRATINVHLTKDVEELTVALLGEDGVPHAVEWTEKLTPFNEAGWHEFDYDAGVDHGADPPPDGPYAVTMQARDALGQWTVATGTLTIQDGGVPRAYILNGEVEWPSEGPKVTLPLSGTLTFTLTVENDGNVPIRTSGPPPGTIYRSDQNYATLGEFVQSGVFRVGIHCENNLTDHPWRWAVGGPGDLVPDGEGHLYLPAGARAVVSGGVRFVDVVGARNPQYCYASLIHEDVEISMVNSRVDPIQVEIDVP